MCNRKLLSAEQGVLDSNSAALCADALGRLQMKDRSLQVLSDPCTAMHAFSCLV